MDRDLFWDCSQAHHCCTARAWARDAQRLRRVVRGGKLTIEQVVAIKHPSDPIWSPDGKHVAFVWDQGGIGNLYLANADGSGAPVALTSFADDHIYGAFWSHDGQFVYFPHDGDLWKVGITGGRRPLCGPLLARNSASRLRLTARASPLCAAARSPDSARRAAGLAAAI